MKHFFGALRNVFVSFLIAILVAISYLPERISFRIGGFLVRWIFVFDKRHRHFTKVNIDSCFPTRTEAQRQEILENHFQFLGYSFIELAWFLSRPASFWEDRIDIEISKDAQKFIDKKGPLIAHFYHMLNIELVAVVFGKILGDRASDLGIIARIDTHKIEYHLVCGRRSSYVGKTLDRKRTAKFISKLRGNKIVTVASDQDLLGIKSLVKVPFFGIPVNTATTLPRLAKIAKADIIFVSIVRTQTFPARYRARIYTLDGYPTGDVKQDVITLNEEIQKSIEEYPSDYFWGHRRFRSNEKINAEYERYKEK